MSPKLYPEPGDVLVDPEGDVLEVTGITVEFKLNGVATLATLGSWRADAEHDVMATAPFVHGLLPDNFFAEWTGEKAWDLYDPHTRKHYDIAGNFEDVHNKAWSLERKRGQAAE